MIGRLQAHLVQPLYANVTNYDKSKGSECVKVKLNTFIIIITVTIRLLKRSPYRHDKLTTIPYSSKVVGICMQAKLEDSTFIFVFVMQEAFNTTEQSNYVV